MSTSTSVKCLVWDLDNTLWDGTVLEGDRVRLFDGVAETLRALDERGILNSVASKNDADLALSTLADLGVAEYFVLPKIGWNPKSESVRSIAETLRFAEGAMAFVDDQPQERAEVRHGLPQVRCYAADEVPSLLDRPEFSPGTVTADARRRRQMYQATFRREAERETFLGTDQGFLRSLELEMTIGRATETQLGRVEELTRRTTQMNTTGICYSEESLRAMLPDPGYEVLTASVTDRFGPYGAVGVLVMVRRPSAWHLTLVATSCRVVSLGAGALILSWLANEAARAGVHLVADFRPTDRNRIMEVTYRFAGFAEETCGCLAEFPAAADGVLRLHRTPVWADLTGPITVHAVELRQAAGLC